MQEYNLDIRHVKDIIIPDALSRVMTLIFMMASETTAQESRNQEVCAWTFLRFSYRFFLLFLSLSLLVYCAFISYFCIGLACSRKQAGLLKKRQRQS